MDIENIKAIAVVEQFCNKHISTPPSQPLTSKCDFKPQQHREQVGDHTLRPVPLWDIARLLSGGSLV